MVGGEAILVVGATGSLGAPVVRQLAHDGYRVRVLARDRARARAMLGPDVDYVEGHVGDDAAVEQAVAGCYGVHISLAARNRRDLDLVEHHGTTRVARAAASSGVRRISYVTGSLVHAEYGEKIPEHRAKLAAEEAILRSGLPFVFFRPSYFIDSLPRHIQGKAAVALGRPQPLHMVAASDFASMVSRAFRAPEAANREFVVHGPQAVSITEALGLYCLLVERDKRVVTVPLTLMKVVDRLFMGGQLHDSLELMGLLQRVGERGDPSEAARLLGAPRTTVAEWCLGQRTTRTNKAVAT